MEVCYSFFQPKILTWLTICVSHCRSVSALFYALTATAVGYGLDKVTIVSQLYRCV